MKNTTVLIMAALASIAWIGCRSEVKQAAAESPSVAAVTAIDGNPGASLPGAKAPMGKTGKVVETMNSGGYTYVLVDDGSKKIWAAAPQVAVAVGDEVILPEGTPMSNFFSKTLNRTFDVVYFVAGIQVVGGKSANEPAVSAPAVSAHGAAAPAAAGAAVDVSNIEKAKGGYRVAELYAGKATMVGKEVLVRGKVVKANPGVMGKNWIHVRDGSGAAGTDDLTVTTSATATLGNTVLVRGKLGADRDFGAGYRYDIIIEDAVVTVE